MSSWSGLLSALVLSGLGCATTIDERRAELELLNAPRSCREILRDAAREANAKLEGRELAIDREPIEVTGIDLPKSTSSTTGVFGTWLRFDSSGATFGGWPLGAKPEEIAEEIAARIAEVGARDAIVTLAASYRLPARALEAFFAPWVSRHGSVRFALAVRRAPALAELDDLTWDVRRRLELGRVAALGRSSAGLSEPIDWPPLHELIEACEITEDQVEPALAVLHEARRPMAVELVAAKVHRDLVGQRPTFELLDGEVRVHADGSAFSTSLRDPVEVVRERLARSLARAEPKGSWRLSLGSGSLADLATLFAAAGPDVGFIAPENPLTAPPALHAVTYPSLPRSESPRIWRSTIRALLDEVASCTSAAVANGGLELEVSGDGRITAATTEIPAMSPCVAKKLVGFRLLPSPVARLELRFSGPK
ncbi:MAG: hypothetical protein HYV07_06790 [Deltaproteobacteria bacterium]|nr:hypothetical protein [Deltaproteobacteria bacterium]